MYQVIKVKKYT